LKSLTARFLEILAATVDSLNIGLNPTFNPTIVVVSALILTGTVAFSKGFTLPVLILVVSVVLILLTRSPIRTWCKIPLLISVWATMVSVPLPFITSGQVITHMSLGWIKLEFTREGLDMMVTFVSRVAAAGAIFTSFAFIMGWRGIVRGLEGLRIPRELGLLLNLSIIHIPLFLREAAKMLSARESRIVRKIRLKEVWGVLSTVVGDLLLRSYERTWTLEKAIRARTFTPTGLSWKTPSAAVGIRDLLLLSFSLWILIVAVLGMV